MERQGFETFREVADVLGVVEGLNVLARPGNGHAVQQLEKIEVQRSQDGAGGALLRWQLGPGVERRLCTPEYLVDVLLGAQLVAKQPCIAFISQGQLVAQIVEPVVDRRGGQHQHLGFDALLDDGIHQLLVARLLVLVDIVVAEVVRLINDHQVIVAPVDPVKRRAKRLAAGALQIGMAQHFVVEPVFGEDVGFEVAVVGEPVVGQLLGTQHQHRAIAQLVVLDDGQRREGFAQAHAIGQDAAVVGFQLVDDAGGGIALEVEQLLPHQGVQVAGAVVGQHVFGEVFQELVEDVVEHQEVDALGRILLVHRRNVLAHQAGHVFELVGISPNLVKQAQKNAGIGGLVELVDDIGDGIAALVAQIHSGKAVQRHVNGIGRCCGSGLHRCKLLHGCATAVGPELGLAAHPVGTFAGDGTLGQFVFELHLEFGAVEAALCIGFGDVEFTPLFFGDVGHLVGHERRRREYELKRLDRFQLAFQGLVGVNGKA